MQVNTDTRRLPIVIKREIGNAPLPVNYRAAKTALAECVRVDECKDWSDRAVAIASYAKQIRDKTMLHHAQRIVLRARERLGELLLQYPRHPVRNRKIPRDKSIKTRYDVAEEHGLTRAFADQALSIARVPKLTRDEKIESSPPIAPSNLAGMAPRIYPRFRGVLHTQEIDLEEAKAQDAWDDLSMVYDKLERLGDPIDWARRISAYMAEDVPMLRRRIISMQEWLDDFERALAK